MKRFSLLALVALFFAACGNENGNGDSIEPLSQEALSDSIDALDSLLLTDVQFDTVKSKKMIGWCLEYASRFPEDSLAPVYMQKSAMIEMNDGNFDEAVATLDSIIELYPGYENVADCHYLKGWAYEQNQKYDLARETYTVFVENYPNHVLASDIRKTLSLVGMTPEEQLKVALAHQNKKKVR